MVPLARRRTGVKNGCGTARDVVCFVATLEFRIIRLHTRYRRDLTEERTREKRRAEKLLLRHEALLLPDGGERPSISPAVVAAG